MDDKPNEDDPYYDELLAKEHDEDVAFAFFVGLGFGMLIGGFVVWLGISLF